MDRPAKIAATTRRPIRISLPFFVRSIRQNG
jgi:hypothetical protein